MVLIPKTVLQGRILDFENAVKCVLDGEFYAVGGLFGSIMRDWLNTCPGESVDVQDIAEGIDRLAQQEFLEIVMREASRDRRSVTLNYKLGSIVLVAKNRLIKIPDAWATSKEVYLDIYGVLHGYLKRDGVSDEAIKDELVQCYKYRNGDN